MSILIDRDTRVIVQGITGKTGTFFTRGMLNYGTKIVAGVSPGKGGVKIDNVPVYDTVGKAVAEEGAEVSVIFIPAPQAKDGILEAIDGNIKLIVYLGEYLPVQDMMIIKRKLREKSCRMMGPNTPGIISPGEAKIGFMPSICYRRGHVGLISRSGSLSYEIADTMTKAGIGQSTAVGIGGDSVKGSDFVDMMELFEQDPETHVIVIVGEIGGIDEEKAAEYISAKGKKPVVCYIAGRCAPWNRKMGHAGAIIQDGKGSFESKVKALKEAGAQVADWPHQVAVLVGEILRKM